MPGTNFPQISIYVNPHSCYAHVLFLVKYFDSSMKNFSAGMHGAERMAIKSTALDRGKKHERCWRMA